MRISAAFPSDYLKAADLDGRNVKVSMSHVEMKDIGGDHKPILFFIGKEKGLVLNKTNASKIAQLLGSKDTDDWAGCKIKLYSTEAEFGGETFEAIRVKAAAAGEKPAPKPVTEDLDVDSVPF
jgi:hypothetical protein